MNSDRRKSVMSRSIKLGHCVCNPQQGCPCETFKLYGVCQCAGEKLAAKTGAVPLTSCVKHAGCASKIGQADLLRILKNLPPVNDPRVLVGVAAGDDAGVYKINDSTALVQTVDVFTPCVDDPYLFGQIAAANSVSDVYAMGGKPLTALSIIGFPIDTLDGQIMEALLRGGIDKLNEAGCALIGGHSLQDDEIKLGFAVTGLMNPAQVVERNRARPGDVLVLTKPLGTGILSFGVQIGRVAPAALEEAGRYMATLNRDAAELMVAHGAHAATDVTGFGLAGHLVEMARGSRVCAELDLERLPVYRAVPDCIRDDILSGAIERNREYAMGWVDVKDPAGEAASAILYDAQTSGGMLVSLAPEAARAFIADMHARGHACTREIGRMMEKSDAQKECRVYVVNRELKTLV